MVSIHSDGDKLVIEPFHHKSAALQKLQALFENTPDEFEKISEQEISKIVSKEIKLNILGK